MPPKKVAPTVVYAPIKTVKYSIQQRNPDIKSWRNANIAAKNIYHPNRTQLYDIYDELLLDGKLVSLLERIRLKCVNSKIVYHEEGRSPESLADINAFLESPYFLDLLKYIIESAWYGYSLIEIRFTSMVCEKVALIPRRNVLPETEEIMLDRISRSGDIKYKEPPYNNFLLGVGDPEDLGLLNVCAAQIIYKRGAKADWAKLIQRAGSPTIITKYDPNTPNAANEAMEQTENLADSAAATFPLGSEVDIFEPSGSINSSMAKDFIGDCNSELAQILVLQTMTTENGSSRSQAEVHLAGEDDLIKGYKTLIENVLNTNLKPILTAHGFDVANGRFKYDNTVQYSQEELLAKVQGLAQFGEFDLAYLEETFGVKLNPKKEQTPAPGESSPAAKPKLKFSEKYGKACCGHDKNTVKLSRKTQIEVLSAQEDLLRRVYESGGELNFDNADFAETSRLLMQGFDLGWSKKMEKYDDPAFSAKALMEFNTNRFALSKDKAVIAELNSLLKDSKDFEDFASKASPVLGEYNKNYLQTEYNLARNTAEATQKHYKQLEDMDNFPYVEYQTVGDDRVRAAHAELNGLFFKVGEAGALTPPNGYNCRCELVPRTEAQAAGKDISTEEQAFEQLSQDEFEKMQNTGFAVNRAETGEVFTNKQFYTQINEGEDLDYSDFDLASYKEVSKKAPVFEPEKLTKEQQNSWFDSKISKKNGTDKEKLYMLDYDERPLYLARETMLTTDIQTDAITKILDLVGQPDEVYLVKTGKSYTVKFLKHYQTNPLVAEVEYTVKNGGAVKKLYQATKADTQRTGLLIKKPKK